MAQSQAKWYMISCVAGKEDKALDFLHNKIKQETADIQIEEFKVFKIPVRDFKSKSAKNSEQKFRKKMVNMYKGYFFVKAVMDDVTWFLIRNTQYITGIVGSSGKGAKPTPISERQISLALEKQKKAIEDFENDDSLEVPITKGQWVKILQGNFKNSVGLVKEVDPENKSLYAEIEIFGKKVPTKFSFDQVELFDPRTLNENQGEIKN